MTWASSLRNSGSCTLACWKKVNTHILSVNTAYTLKKGSQSLILI